ncbi:MAG: helix-turn-helix transcriptional regulator [Candidatus Eremiobacteraeota bacterium]|nr:helix-turn-helix transcriptional regulator [Candidatus Eremiobacteraeota bacterium]
MATSLGNRLKLIRERLGLSRSEVARRADIDPAMLFRIENADNAAPTFAVVTRVARVLGASLEWLAQDEKSEEQGLKMPVVFDFDARRAIVTAAGHLEFAIKSWTDESEVGKVAKAKVASHEKKARAKLVRKRKTNQ